MPEDQPQAPANPTPATPPQPPEVRNRQRKSELQEFSALLQSAWQRTRPILKQQSLALLRLTIRALEQLATRLEVESSPELLVDKAEVTSTPSRSSSSAAPGIGQRLEQFRPQWQRFQGWWFKALAQIRSRLPASINQKLSDRALSGVVAGVLVLGFWTTTSLFSGQSHPSAVTPVPLAQRQAPADLSAPIELNAPAEVQPVEITPPPIAPPILPPAIAELPVEAPEPDPLPAPALELTPEQSLIAAIQDQVAVITDRYASGLIQSIQANFQSSRLIVNIGEGWYRLNAGQQDQLARELLQRSQELEFTRLTLKDGEGRLLARSPIVGTDMVILKRQIG